ncbi:hypothetical protein F5888DRAFT_1635480 [Russula emetica]|nr:hypothetical protein F5888DRAFT_1635480 [Russula emetica]
MEQSLNVRESGSDYSSIPRSVQSIPNYQLHLCGPPNPHTHLPLEDLSLTHGQVPDSSFEYHPPNGVDAIHAAPARWGHYNAVPWGDTNPQMEPRVIENHNPRSLPQNVHGVSSSSDLLELSPPMIADDFSSLYVGSYTPSEVQDDYAGTIPSPPGEARSTTSPVETQGQDATVQEASQQGQQPSTKREKDKERKRVQRSEDVQHFTNLLSVFIISILGGGVDYIIVLVGVEALVERQEHDSDLRHRLEESEAEVTALREDLARVSSERTTVSRLAMKANTALGDSDKGATRQSWS